MLNQGNNSTEAAMAAPTDQAADSFEILISRARTGDEVAMEELWTLCRRYLLTIANHDLGANIQQKLGASDVVQQSMMIASQKLPSFVGTTKAEFFAWMKQVVIFECRQATRKFQTTEKRSVSRERSMTEDSTAVGGGLQVADPHLTPSTQVTHNEETELVRAALLRLDPLYRQVIQLRNWDELSFEEIGKRIRKSADASRKIWSRAIAKLEQELKRMNAI